MVASKIDFHLKAGNDRKLAVTVEQNEAVLDLSGSSVKFQASRSKVSSTKDLTYSTATGGLVLTDAENGLFTVSILSADTLTLSGKYFWDCLVRDASGNDITVIEGCMFVTPVVVDSI